MYKSDYDWGTTLVCEIEFVSLLLDPILEGFDLETTEEKSEQ